MRRCVMTALLIGCARCSTDQQDLTAQHDGLITLGVSLTRIHLDHRLIGTTVTGPVCARHWRPVARATSLW